MAGDRKTGRPQDRPLCSRASFLYQAAALLASQPPPPAAAPALGREGTAGPPGGEGGEEPPLQGMSRRMLADLRKVSLKTMMRLSPDMKRTICKFCDTLLVEGRTSSSTVENKSKGGRKPWADVLVVKCTTCGGEKRFPVSARRQPRKVAPPRARLKGGGGDHGETTTVTG